MNKMLCALLAFSIFSFYSNTNYSSTAVVTLVGAKLYSLRQEPSIIKYKRKNCPVCKGKGWYMSGDDIKKIDCTYCEPDEK